MILGAFQSDALPDVSQDNLDSKDFLIFGLAKCFVRSKKINSI